MLVVDASFVVAALLDGGHVGEWARRQMADAGPLVSAQVLPAEVASTLRRLELSGQVSTEMAASAHDDLGALRIDLLPCRRTAGRVWELRHNVTSYDAWYVAIAEGLAVPLATLDRRVAGAPGPRCAFLTPEIT